MDVAGSSSARLELGFALVQTPARRSRADGEGVSWSTMGSGKLQQLGLRVYAQRFLRYISPRPSLHKRPRPNPRSHSAEVSVGKS